MAWNGYQYTIVPPGSTPHGSDMFVDHRVPSNGGYQPYGFGPPPSWKNSEPVVSACDDEYTSNESFIRVPQYPPEQFQLSQRPPVKRRSCFDYPTTFLLFSVWLFLTTSTGLMLRMARTDSMTSDQVWGTIVIAFGPILLATILNEVFVDRCWRRVQHSALGYPPHTYNAPTMAKNIRAANFEWLGFMKRLWTHELSFRDFRALASYAILRWGTTISIASVQLCVRWTPVDSTEQKFAVHRRVFWLIGPVVLHSLCTFTALLIWLLPPWQLFSARYDDAGLLERYMPYLRRIHDGSIATYEEVARYLDPRHRAQKPLAKEHTPGPQFWSKFKGIWFGLVFMNIPPAVFCGFMFTSQSQELAFGVLRFALHLAILAQNVFYLIAFDFVIWNLSLEGICKDDKTMPIRHMHHLHTSSGIMLIIKACKQRRPFRASIFMWLFWMQACVMRLLTVVWTLDASMFRYGYKDDVNFFYDKDFWIGWMLCTSVIVFPLFFFWFIMPFQAPICGQDGWRWAKIAQSVVIGGSGNYGVLGEQAAWGSGPDLQSFKTWKQQCREKRKRTRLR